MASYGLFLLHVVTFIVIITKTSGSGQLEVLFVRYDNSDGEGNNGNPCDGMFGIARSECDHYFTLCVDTGDSGNSMQRCRIGSHTTGMVHNQDSIDFDPTSIGDTENPVTFSFNEWPAEGIKVKVEVWDDDSSNDHDLVEKLYSEALEGPPGSKASPLRIDAELSSRTTLTLKLTAYCDPEWYGDSCSDHCKTSDSDVTGHYNCSTSGSKVCHPGWKGKNCTINRDDCADVTCQHGGQCQDGVNSFVCDCSGSYTGTYCESSNDVKDPCASSPCQQGACVKQGDGYTCTDVSSNNGDNSTIVTDGGSSMKFSSYWTAVSTLFVFFIWV